MYDPSTVRFLTKDPEEYFGNDPNLYRYAANDPVNNTDPSGRDPNPLPKFFKELAEDDGNGKLELTWRKWKAKFGDGPRSRSNFGQFAVDGVSITQGQIETALSFNLDKPTNRQLLLREIEEFYEANKIWDNASDRPSLSPSQGDVPREPSKQLNVPSLPSGKGKFTENDFKYYQDLTMRAWRQYANSASTYDKRLTELREHPLYEADEGFRSMVDEFADKIASAQLPNFPNARAVFTNPVGVHPSWAASHPKRDAATWELDLLSQSIMSDQQYKEWEKEVRDLSGRINRILTGPDEIEKRIQEAIEYHERVVTAAQALGVAGEMVMMGVQPPGGGGRGTIQGLASKQAQTGRKGAASFGLALDAAGQFTGTSDELLVMLRKAIEAAKTRGAKTKLTRIADRLELLGEDNIRILSDVAFEELAARNSQRGAVALYVSGTVYLKKSRGSHLLEDLVHEGMHSLDFSPSGLFSGRDPSRP